MRQEAPILHKHRSFVTQGFNRSPELPASSEPVGA